MNIITLSKKKFEKLVPVELAREIMNTEGEIFDFPYKRNQKILKRLYHDNGIIFANKLYTLEMLNSNELPDYFCIPDNLVSVSNKIVGFTLPKKEGINMEILLKDKSLPLEEHIFYLKKVGEILQEMKSIRTYTSLTDFYLNDLHESNFIADTKNKIVSVVDLDSAKIGDNLVSASRYLTPYSLCCQCPHKYHIVSDNYSRGYIISTEETDLYCYTMMILNYLRGSNVNSMSLEEFYNFLNYLDIIGMNKELIDIFNNLLTNVKNKNPYLLLDAINYKQLYLSRTKKLK